MSYILFCSMHGKQLRSKEHVIHCQSAICPWCVPLTVITNYII